MCINCRFRQISRWTKRKRANKRVGTVIGVRIRLVSLKEKQSKFR